MNPAHRCKRLVDLLPRLETAAPGQTEEEEDEIPGGEDEGDLEGLMETQMERLSTLDRAIHKLSRLIGWIESELRRRKEGGRAPCSRKQKQHLRRALGDRKLTTHFPVRNRRVSSG